MKKAAILDPDIFSFILIIGLKNEISFAFLKIKKGDSFQSCGRLKLSIKSAPKQ